MNIIESLTKDGHEQVLFCQNEDAGLKAIIAIHSTGLGPSLGGTRMWNYSSEEAALRDVLRLSKGMTYKASISGLNLGGGKAVIIGDPYTAKSELLFRTFGKFVDGLAGRYITSADVGTTVADLEYIRMETKFVTGIPESRGGSGDPSPVTGYGVYVGLKACAAEYWGNDSLKDKKIIVQGVGKVGGHLCEHLFNEGARLFICDINPGHIAAILKKVKAEVIEEKQIHAIDADIYSPNALGAVINDETVGKLKVAIVGGGANNQLADEEKHGRILREKGILFAPDYVINAGGLINVANELEGYSRDRALKQTDGIYDTLLKIFKISRESGIPAHEASNRIAEERINSIKRINQIYTGSADYTGRFSYLYDRSK